MDQSARFHWEEAILHRFLDECPSRILIYSYPKRNFFREHMSVEKWNSFLSREKEHPTDVNGLRKLSRKEWELLAGMNHSDSVEQFLDEFNQIKIDIVNGISYFNDKNGRYFHFENGIRITENTSGNQVHAEHSIFVFGACNILGLFCKPDKTIPFFLQNMCQNNGRNVRVLNCGVWGSENILSSLYRYPYTCNDIVILVMTGFSGEFLWKIARDQYMGDFSKEIALINQQELFLWNNIAHHGVGVNHVMAKKIYHDLCHINPPERKEIVYKPKDFFVSWEIYRHYLPYKEHVRQGFTHCKTGAIVMNANPFTMGHLFLIEKALSEMDFLYVFVVEEDKSEFSFHDRLTMVKVGTKHLDNVKVLPSGSYMISQMTFPDYFEKTQITEIRDMSYDIYVFVDVIVPIFRITHRFVGTEPYDAITLKYNHTMKRILTEYGIEYRECERKQIGKEIISASKVRKWIRSGEYSKIQRFVPATTLELIKQNRKM